MRVIYFVVAGELRCAINNWESIYGKNSEDDDDGNCIRAAHKIYFYENWNELKEKCVFQGLWTTVKTSHISSKRFLFFNHFFGFLFHFTLIIFFFHAKTYWVSLCTMITATVRQQCNVLCWWWWWASAVTARLLLDHSSSECFIGSILLVAVFQNFRWSVRTDSRLAFHKLYFTLHLLCAWCVCVCCCCLFVRHSYSLPVIIICAYLLW